MHMAQAVGTPLVALFGPTDLGIWSPTAENARVLHGNQSCIPCLQHGCGGSGRSDCVLSIEPGQVIREITPLLGELVPQ
jgi:ADP-heptose:LPS heptosyltransferase